MKRFLLPLVLLLPLAGQAQTIPNSGLETWVASGSRERVQDWYTSDDYVASLGSPVTIVSGLVTKSTDRYAGSFAARLQSKQTLLPIPGLTGYAPGILLIGSGLDIQNPTSSGGVPFTGRPSSVRFWYKATVATGDQAGAFVQLSRGPQASQQTLGEGVLALSTTANYTQAEMPVVYNSATATLAPETLRLGFLAGNTQVSATTTLFVDEITLVTAVTSTQDAALNAALSVYPNPSSTGTFALASLDKPEVATAPLTVTDALGRVVYQEKGVSRQLYNGRPLSLQKQVPGLYMLRLDTPAGPVTRRLVIQ